MIPTARTVASTPSRRARLTALAGALSLSFATVPAALSAQARPSDPPLDLHLPEGVDQAAALIDRETIDTGIRFLADDKMEGRAPASKGDELARAYLQAELRRLGFQPGAPEGGYQQPVPFVSILSELPQAWTFQAGGEKVKLALRDDYIGGSLAQQETSTIRDAELVFVGYGIQAPEYRWDDFKGADLRGKVLVMLNGDPDWDPNLFEGVRRLYYGRWAYKYESGARQGAAAVILLHTSRSAGYPWQVVQSSWSGKQFHLPEQPEQPEQPAQPGQAARPARGGTALQLGAWVTEEAMRRIAAAGGHDLAQLVAAARSRDFRPIPLGVKTSLSFRNQVAHVQSANVLGRLEGSDPALKSEIVLYTAHHDHLGIGAPDKTGDRIYNGARDNASGCAMALAVAKAYAALPRRPKRTIVVAFVAGEEQGLLGSAYLAAHPPAPPGKIAANVNFDGGTFLGRTTDATFVGYGKSSLDPIVEALAARQGRKVHGDRFPDLGLFYRSDQFNFAKIGVPALFLASGEEVIGAPPGWGSAKLQAWNEEHYHQPSDNYDPNWNLSGLIEDAQLGFLTGLSVAETPELPAWNPGDEFEEVRKRALGELP